MTVLTDFIEKHIDKPWEWEDGLSLNTFTKAQELRDSEQRIRHRNGLIWEELVARTCHPTRWEWFEDEEEKTFRRSMGWG